MGWVSVGGLAGGCPGHDVLFLEKGFRSLRTCLPACLPTCQVPACLRAYLPTPDDLVVALWGDRTSRGKR